MVVLTTLGQVVGAEVAAAPSSWSRALFWLYNKMEELDWTVRFHLKPVWGEHFKNEVPSSLLTVCDLPEQVRTPLDSTFLLLTAINNCMKATGMLLTVWGLLGTLYATR